MSKTSTKIRYLVGVLALASTLPATSAMSVKLERSTHPVLGEIMTWTADASETGTIRYRYRVRHPGSTDFQMIRDFGPFASLDWAADQDGRFEIEAAAKNLETGEIAETTSTFEVHPRATGSEPVVNPTSHPLVFVFSAPACPAQNRMRVKFQGPGTLDVGH